MKKLLALMGYISRKKFWKVLTQSEIVSSMDLTDKKIKSILIMLALDSAQRVAGSSSANHSIIFLTMIALNSYQSC